MAEHLPADEELLDRPAMSDAHRAEAELADSQREPATLSESSSKLGCSCGAKVFAHPMYVRCEPANALVPTQQMCVSDEDAAEDERARCWMLPVVRVDGGGMELHLENAP